MIEEEKKNICNGSKLNMIVGFSSGFWEQCQARPDLWNLVCHFPLLPLNVNIVVFYSQGTKTIL